MDLAAVSKRLEAFEGRVAYMYLCTGGDVTIGIGHALPQAADAVALAWSVGGRVATADEIRADWERVAAAAKGKLVSAYESLTQCRMSDAQIDALVASDVGSFTAGLARALPNWASYPEPALEALFDMAFNLGIAGLKKFPKLLASVDAGRWQAAASECHRMGISDARNRETAALFLAAVPH